MHKPRASFEGMGSHWRSLRTAAVAVDKRKTTASPQGPDTVIACEVISPEEEENEDEQNRRRRRRRRRRTTTTTTITRRQ
ncbi:hypothetical protein BaRGS_00015794 [Batillaria attramentaria]|uniref:Uncharacterized protein n=1 Tax=Batillaria attramentaria TaxID=370345 RepID=A0ABD0L0N4_9CAEN